ncbi:D-beta-hydroxybutyrate dehydrogenase-like isoform X2 [Amphiura filiformis]
MSSTSNNNGSPRVLTALVTGSTRPHGIGFGIARSLAKNSGINIILHGTRNATTEEVEKCRSDLAKEHNISVDYIQADLSSVSDTQKLCHQIDELYPDGIDILVNNAGMTHYTLVDDIPLKVWEDLQTSNLTSPFMLIKHFIPRMKKRGWGRIINISSGLGIRAGKLSSAYCSSKHGLNGLTKAVGLEAADTGVTCNAICPGFVETDMYRNITEGFMKAKEVSKETAEATLTNPSKKLVSTEQIGDLVSFLCSPAADSMTTAELCIDGGLSA